MTPLLLIDSNGAAVAGRGWVGAVADFWAVDNMRPPTHHIHKRTIDHAHMEVHMPVQSGAEPVDGLAAFGSDLPCNDCFRDECPNEHWFSSLAHAGC